MVSLFATSWEIKKMLSWLKSSIIWSKWRITPTSEWKMKRCISWNKFTILKSKITSNGTLTKMNLMKRASKTSTTMALLIINHTLILNMATSLKQIKIKLYQWLLPTFLPIKAFPNTTRYHRNICNHRSYLGLETSLRMQVYNTLTWCLIHCTMKTNLLKINNNKSNSLRKTRQTWRSLMTSLIKWIRNHLSIKWTIPCLKKICQILKMVKVMIDSKNLI